jgi:ketosteroid isomerase-like protein
MTEQPHVELISRFYAALSRRDWAAMAACYHPQVHFTDEAFDLHGADAGNMWRMLCTLGRDLTLDFSGISADATSGRAHWDARYTFSATGRKVLNRIDARFEFRDGLIVRHVDRFDFWRWSRQALGAPGWLLGWSGFLRGKVRQRAAASLAAFVRNNPTGAAAGPAVKPTA